MNNNKILDIWKKNSACIFARSKNCDFFVLSILGIKQGIKL